MPPPHHPTAAVRRVRRKLGLDIRDARRRRGLQEGRAVRTLQDMHYLLGVRSYGRSVTSFGNGRLRSASSTRGRPPVDRTPAKPLTYWRWANGFAGVRY